jgi:hypothetical protein
VHSLLIQVKSRTNSHVIQGNTGFKKSFTTLRAYINLLRGNVQCLELL